MESSEPTKSILSEVSSGSATKSTVDAIQRLLHNKQGPSSVDLAGRSRPGRAANSNVAKTSRSVLRDDCRLTGSQARAFATDLATAGAKTLAEARASQSSRSALQPSSGNASPGKLSSCAKSTPGAPRPTNAIIAECTALALCYLRSFVSDKTRWRLVEATLALVKHLLALKMPDLAYAELKACQDMFNIPDGVDHTAEKQSLTLLLQMQLPKTDDTGALRLAVVYQTLVLKTISLDGAPQVLNSLAEYLQQHNELPHAIINQYLESSGDSAKSAIYLESISADLLALCPKLSDSADSKATDSTLSPSPQAVFHIQAYALQIRRIWWRLAKHEVDRSKALSEQFLKVTRVYMRRSISQRCKVFQDIEEAYTTIFEDPIDPVTANQDLRKIMKAAGQKELGPGAAAKAQPAMSNTEAADCTQLVAMARSLADEVNEDIIDEQLDLLAMAIERRPVEGKSLAALSIELSRLIRKQCTGKAAVLSKPRTRLVKAVLDLISWTGSKCSALETRSQQSIVLSALRTFPRKQAAAWMNMPIAAIAASGGVLAELEQAAKGLNVAAAFKTSPATILLGEVLELIVFDLSTAQSSIEVSSLTKPLLDTMSDLQHGVLLEWLLRACLKYAGGARPASALKELTEQSLRRLFELYTIERHPCRRAVVSIQASLVLSKGLVHQTPTSSHGIIISDKCGLDTAMQSYIPELRACLKTCQAFEGSRDDLKDIQSAISAWQPLLPNALSAMLYDMQCSTKLLEGLLSFCQALGLAEETLSISDLLMRIGKQEPNRHASALVAHSEAKLRVNASMSEHTSQLQHNADDSSLNSLVRISSLMVLAEARLTVGDCAEAESALVLASTLSGTSPATSKSEAAMLCAQAWRVHSYLCMSQGQLREAVQSAKTAVSIVNSLWLNLEQRSRSTEPSQQDDSDVDSMVETSSKISKLQLKSHPPTARSVDGGRAFWALLPLASATLLSLAECYIHAGLFAEARHHLTKLVEMTEAVQGSLLALTARTKLAELLIAAGKTDEAELCLAKVECPTYAQDREVAVQMHRTQALLHAKLGENEEALSSLERAITIAQSLSQRSAQTCSTIESKASRAKKPPAVKKSNGRATAKRAAKVETELNDAQSNTNHVLDALLAQKARLCMKMGIELDQTMLRRAASTSDQRQVQHLSAMASLEEEMQTHVVFNAIHDSTLIWPAFKASSQPDKGKAKTSTSKGKAIKSSIATKRDLDPLATMLAEARSVLVGESNSRMDAVHHETRMLLDSRMYAATSTLAKPSGEQSSDLLRLTSAAASLARRREAQVVLQGSQDASLPSKLPWPTKPLMVHKDSTLPGLASSLPQSWAAVELMLNEDCSALIAVRHRRGQEALILRLPFARQDMDHEDGPFDFAAGRAELRDIIEQSNRICHVGNDGSSRMTSTTWWREREDLDQRLQELLTNIEEMWFGGFKGVLCPSAQRRSALVSFREELESILVRHVPGVKNAHLSDAMLQLFLDLLHGQAEELDLDSAVLDLWYGVIDALRFNGLELAYDELDFDSLFVEAIDALQNVHNDAVKGNDAHLILILDKKLHNFPWESMPYLSHTSVSRMADITSLQARLAGVGEQYCLRPEHGSVILDPSSDMKRTQQTLQPVLQHLRGQHPAWTVLSGQKPTETEFEKALQTSDLLMYFGHGAGSQYIRPRTIKKLEACSKVVWLMGCSSGEVIEHDELEPTSVPAAYLLAADGAPDKCMAVVANLWDVTDKDIDRFSIALGEDWGLWDGGEEGTKSSKVSRAREPLRTPPASPKTPRAPKMRANAPDRSAPPRIRAAEPCNLAQAVSNSRDACYLRYLNGAAPVVYGLPVLLG